MTGARNALEIGAGGFPDDEQPDPDDDEAGDYIGLGVRAARAEVADGYTAAESREERKRASVAQYDEDHAEYFRQRDRCVAGFLDGYYSEWMAIQEERRAARLAAQDAERERWQAERMAQGLPPFP